jgi:hypothetical protein
MKRFLIETAIILLIAAVTTVVILAVLDVLVK